MMVSNKTEVVAIETSCGHIVYMTDSYRTQLKRSHRNFYCTLCGNPQHWPHESDVERLKRQLSSKEDQLDTMRADRDHKEAQRRGERAAKTKIQRRIAAGVCPCCNRQFQNLREHMADKHPSFCDQ